MVDDVKKVTFNEVRIGLTSQYTRDRWLCQGAPVYSKLAVTYIAPPKSSDSWVRG